MTFASFLSRVLRICVAVLANCRVAYMQFADWEASSARMRRMWREALAEDEEDDEGNAPKPQSRRSHRFRAGGFARVPRSGDLGGTGAARWRHGVMAKSSWWTLLDAPETFDDGHYFANRFQELFGVPRLLYESYYSQAKDVPRFKDKKAGEAGHRGPDTQPLRIKLLGALMRAFSGSKFTLIQEEAKISAGVLERFYYAWCEFRSSPAILKQCVYTPRSDAELQQVLLYSERIGLPGVVCGFDGVHFEWAACPAHLRHMCKDKHGIVTVMFNVAADHACITDVYGPDYGARNDKTASRLHHYMVAIRDGKAFGGVDYGQAQYSMFKQDGSRQTMTGALGLIDNGYHRWTRFVWPEKQDGQEWVCRVSEREESVRKLMSECHFGKAKKRFGELRKPFYVKDMRVIGHVVKTCFGIHNDMTRFHGLHVLANSAANWSTASPDQATSRVFAPPPRVLPHIHIGRGETDAVGNDLFMEQQVGWQATRDAMTTHFRVAFQNKTLLWPKSATAVLGHRNRKGYLDDRPLELGRKAAARARALGDSEDEDDDSAPDPYADQFGDSDDVNSDDQAG